LQLGLDKAAYLRAYRAWLAARLDDMRRRVAGSPKAWDRLAPYAFFIYASGDNALRITRHMQDVEAYGDFPGPGMGSATGTYQGVRISILHQPVGPTWTESLMAGLAGSPVRAMIGLGEMGAMQNQIGIGDVILPTVCIPDDGVTQAYWPAGLPASADARLSTCLAAGIRRHLPEHLHLYPGPAWGATAWMEESPDKSVAYLEAGVLGLCLETSAHYIAARRAGIAATSAWSVADSPWALDLPRPGSDAEARWSAGWDAIAVGGLDAFVAYDQELRHGAETPHA
jgi:guanosine phosphorylase